MRLLRKGSTGPAVQFLQLGLDRAGFGPLKTDGLFGPATEAALLRFQRANRLAADGAAGPLTHRALQPWQQGFFRHKIRPGDTVWSLAKEYGTSEAAILTANPGLRPQALAVGETLTVPLPFPVVPVDIAWFSGLTGACAAGLAARYPFLRRGEIGKSVLGRPLWSLTLGSGENRALYSAAHHANEWITAPLLLRFAEELAASAAAGGELSGIPARDILDYTTLCLVPAVDPDGIDLVTGELSGGEAYAAARAIAADYPQIPFPSGWKANIRGVDLNLQYPAGWEQARENKAAQGVTGPAPADWVGPAPLSTPESRALYEYTLRFSPALVQAWHTQGEVIYWKFLDYEPPMSRRIAQAFSEASGYPAEETPFASGFAGYKDWFIQDFDRPGYTVEAGRGVNPLPISDFEGIWQKTLGILVLGAVLT